MPRQSVADLLSEVDQEPVPCFRPGPRPLAAPEGAVEHRSRDSACPYPPAPRRERPGPRDAGTAGVTESQTPKWKGLERKELRLRADQLDELARLRRTAESPARRGR